MASHIEPLDQDDEAVLVRDHLAQASDAAGLDVEDIATPTSHHVVVGKMRLHYLEWGTPPAPTVVFLHGGGLNAHTWNLVCLGLCRDYHCYALDFRGHGDSEWSPTLEYSVDAHARDLEGFIDHLGTDRSFVVGHSLGGHVALRYTSRRSELIARLVVIDTSPFVRDGPALAKLRDFMRGASNFDTLDDAVTYVLDYKPDRDPQKLRRTLQLSLRRLPDGRWTWKRDQRHLGDQYFADGIKAARSLVPAARDLRCPVLVVRGAIGALTPQDANRFSSLLVDGRVVTVDRAGHNVQSDNPIGLVEVLRGFLDRHGPSG